MGKSKSTSSSSTSSINRKRLLKWLDSFSKVAAAVEAHGDLLARLDAGGGITLIEDFLPAFVADGILELLEGMTEAQWNVTAATDDYTHNNISHDFLSTKSGGGEALAAVFRALTLLLPDSLFTFSAAKYCRQGHIKPHDDRAYTQVCMEDGSIQLCSRNIACIYYLTRDWSAADGGALIDQEAPGGPQTHIPKFNSLICFTIPRWHEVTPVTTDRPRYSIFGWFLEQGKLYELQLDPQMPAQLQQQPEQQAPEKQQAELKKKKRKNGSSNAPDSPAAAAASQTGRRKKHKKQQQPWSPEQPPQQHSAAAAAAAAAGGAAEQGAPGPQSKHPKAGVPASKPHKKKPGGQRRKQLVRF